MTVGEALRLLRTQKGMTLARAANNALSTAFLSKVERDQNEITFEKLLAILANLNVDFNEFMYVLHDYERDEQSDFIQRYSHALASKNSILMHQLAVDEEKLASDPYGNQLIHHRHNQLNGFVQGVISNNYPHR